ncbi:serine--tRNA ligase, partial [Halobacteriales archaeon SW_7_71_33]
MIDRDLLREEPEAVRRAVETKGVDVDLDRVIELDEQWRELKARGDDLRHERNEVSDRIG